MDDERKSNDVHVKLTRFDRWLWKPIHRHTHTHRFCWWLEKMKSNFTISLCSCIIFRSTSHVLASGFLTQTQRSFTSTLTIFTPSYTSKSTVQFQVELVFRPVKHTLDETFYRSMCLSPSHCLCTSNVHSLLSRTWVFYASFFTVTSVNDVISVGNTHNSPKR